MKKENDILKWFNRELSQQDIKDLKQSEDLDTLEKIKHYSSQLTAPKIDAHQALNAFKQQNKTKPESKVISLNFKTVFKVAAMVIIMLGASYFAFFNTTKNFTTDIAETQSLRLPDNSEVILNAKSSLTFNKKTWKDTRDLTLDGEAFFKVEKGQKFTVNTDAGIVQVLGTQFNVKERDNYFEVICFEGLVSVTHKNKSVTLAKGKGFKVVNNTIELIDNTNNSPSWTKAESSFNNIELNQVIAELERQYDITIEVESIDVSQLFTGTFTHNNLNTALLSVTIPLKISYKIKGSTVTFYKYEEK
ncbi:FecR family protein [Olleya aquimaris]|uniref:FecR family protein n=1 Tax=Olleya aquimaris TaxID=639310 RepID=A0A327RBL7_9FLAO|nr:FecR family protein [Olleya aquimaris]RAJ13495.1 FecR family protein [Olleya aquimaris]